MLETSAEGYLNKLISFITPTPENERAKVGPWTVHIGEVTEVNGTTFQFAPCDYNQPHGRLGEPTKQFDIQHVHDIKVVRRIG